MNYINSLEYLLWRLISNRHEYSHSELCVELERILRETETNNQNPDEFYLQDSRTFVGNNMLFWAHNSMGYSTDLSKAHIFTEVEAYTQHNIRKTDIPWPKSYIDSKTRSCVDCQDVNYNAI